MHIVNKLNMNSIYYPFVDDKFKKIDEKNIQFFFIVYSTEHTSDTCVCTCITNINITKFGY
jgi:hypothetical protein